LFLLCIIYAFICNKKNILCFLACAALSALCFFAVRKYLLDHDITNIFNHTFLSSGSFKNIFSVFSSDEARVKLISRSFEDFSSSPIFGKGLANPENADLYSPKKGAMHWYHMMIPQVIGSLGSVGILAYGLQFVLRIKLIFKKITPYSLCLFISYLGILLMSQVNPGEFCPLPYEMLTVLIFIILERYVSYKK
jgi:hypothetical protein